MWDMSPTTRMELGPAFVRAAFAPATYDAEARTVELVWSTGAEVQRMDWRREEPFIEGLSMESKHVRLGRLNSGRANLLDNHRAGGSVRDVLGVVERAWIVKGEGRALVRFSARESMRDLLNDVRDGIVGSVSVGYRVHSFRNDTKDGDKVRRMTAVDWEPYEVSLVITPADALAGVRSAAEQVTTTCEVIRREADMPDENFGAGVGDDTRGTTATLPVPAPAPAPRTQPVDLDAVRREAADAERTRSAEIRDHCRALNLPDDVVDEMVDSGRSLAEQLPRLRAAYIAMRQSAEGEPTRNRISVGTEDLTLKREAATAALFHRMHPGSTPPAELGELRGRSLLDLMRFHVSATDGDRVALRMGRDELMKRSLHSTADFPVLLQEAGRRTLRAQFEAQATTYQMWTRMGSLVDFRPMKRVQIGDAPDLEKVVEGAKITRGTLGETAETIELAKYGKAVGLTREAIINDDLGAFTRLLGSQARKVAILVEALVYGQLTAGTVGGSSLYSTSSPNRLNYSSGAATALTADPAGIKALDTLAQLVKNQKSISATDFLGLRPKYLIVPTALELVASQLVAPIAAQKQTDVNPYRGVLEVIATPYITATAVEYYLAADPNMIDTIEVAWLDGNAGPQMVMEECFETRGITFGVWAEVAAKAIDFRGLAKSKGAA